MLFIHTHRAEQSRQPWRTSFLSVVCGWKLTILVKFKSSLLLMPGVCSFGEWWCDKELGYFFSSARPAADEPRRKDGATFDFYVRQHYRDFDKFPFARDTQQLLLFSRDKSFVSHPHGLLMCASKAGVILGLYDTRRPQWETHTLLYYTLAVFYWICATTAYVALNDCARHAIKRTCST